MIIYLLSALLSVALLYLHLLGNDGLYYTYFWYDIMMHMLGGFAIGMLVYQFLLSMNWGKYLNWKTVVLAVFFIGFVWEVFEAYFGIAGATVGTRAYYIDTVKDLIDDCIGAFVAHHLASFIAKFTNRKTISQ